MTEEMITDVATPDGQSQNTEAQESEGKTENVAADESSDKFKGDYTKLKKSYEEMEAYTRRVANELSNVRREFDSVKTRLTPSKDPDQAFEERVKKSPYDAVRGVAEESVENTKRRLDSVELKLVMRDMKEVYPDFEELRPHMSGLFERYAHLVNPSNPNAPEYLEFLYLKAREEVKGSFDKRSKKASEKEQKEVQTNKSKSFMEGSSSATRSEDFDKLSLEEMEKLLPKR